MSLKVELVPATAVHIGPIATRMRTSDRLEAEAQGMSPKRALRQGLLTSEEVWTAKVDGRAEAMFGVVVKSAISGVGVPWMLGTDAIYAHPRYMMRWGRAIVQRWADSTPTLENIVSSANGKAIRLLRYWGFDVDSEVIMIGGEPFHWFRMER